MNYQTEIAETSQHLLELERDVKDLKARDRVRFIRFLKTGKADTQKEAGALLGLGERQSQRLWREYRERGLSKMCENRYQGGAGKFDEQKRAALEERLRDDDVKTLAEARTVLREEFAASYTVSGVSFLFKRLGIKLKTGRPTNVKQSAAERKEFAEKNILS